jgi:hypothetical protein
MNRRKLILIAASIAMIAGTAALLAAVPQKLGRPGVKAVEVAGSQRLQIDLPEHVLDFASSNQPPDEKAWEMLPSDTSFADRIYFKPHSIPYCAGVVLMGTDRTSIHKAQYCLQGQGLNIYQDTTDVVHMTQPQPYDLPIVKMLATVTLEIDGKKITKKCVYVYWYVADGALSNDESGFGRMWDMTKKLVFTGVLQRWAYVRFYAFCDPGQEDATYENIKHMIAAAVPQFQTTPAPANAAVAAQ